jgi:hypothetical protein
MCIVLLIPGIFLVGVAVALASLVRFVDMLQQTLDRCDPSNRAIDPRLAWLILVPVVNVVWWFYAVRAVGRSLRAEFSERGIDWGGSYGATLGVAVGATAVMATLVLVASQDFRLTPEVSQRVIGFGFALGCVALMLWGIYFGTMSNFLDELRHDDRRRERDDYGRFDDPPPQREGPRQIEDRTADLPHETP